MQVSVIGAGAAGLMAAAAAAESGADTVVFERNSAAGKKLLISGKGRCNFTRDATVQEIVDGFEPGGKFLYSALSVMGPEELCRLMQTLGVDYKVERGKRIFPLSDRASDVRDALFSYARRNGARFEFGCRTMKLALENGAVIGTIGCDGSFHRADAVIIATGGASYPGTGSTGDGYALAKQAGHTIIKPLPALVPMETSEEWPRQVTGLSLRNVELTLFDRDKEVGREFGEMLFTHYGVSGPIVLSLSRAVCASLRSSEEVEDGRFTLSLDLKPALDRDTLDRRVQRDLTAASRKQLKNSMADLLPKALIPIVISQSLVDETTPANQITVAERGALVQALKCLPLTVSGARPLSEAIVTSGGVHLREVDPSTLQSRLVDGLYFAGEVLDIDAPTGGYNLTAAFATGRLAGLCAAGARRVTKAR